MDVTFNDFLQFCRIEGSGVPCSITTLLPIPGALTAGSLVQPCNHWIPNQFFIFISQELNRHYQSYTMFSTSVLINTSTEENLSDINIDAVERNQCVLHLAILSPKSIITILLFILKLTIKKIPIFIPSLVVLPLCFAVRSGIDSLSYKLAWMKDKRISSIHKIGLMWLVKEMITKIIKLN